MAGPTGETNTLSWRAPKAVTIYGGDKAQTLAVLAALAVNGTKAYVNPVHALADHADALDGILVVAEQPATDANDIVVALSAMPASEQVRLAELDGSIRRVIDATNGLDFTRLYHEVSQSYNTTAAGGNASLMASA